VRTELLESCIFTIRRTSALERISDGERRGELIEDKRWVKGKELLAQARQSGKCLPLIFAAADRGGGLIYWAVIDDITLHTGKRPRTSVRFSALQSLAKQWPKHSLKKLGNDKPLSDDHIRGYVPCHTPRFLFAALPATAKVVPDSMKGDPQHGASDYARAFRKIEIAPHHKRMLQAHYHSDKRTLTAARMAHAMHYENWNGANLQYGKLAKLVGGALGWRPLPNIGLEVLATFEKPEHEWLWIMRAEIAKALEQLGWVGEDADTFPQEVATATPVFEGAVRVITVNAYERSTAARQKCVLHHGPACSACGVVLADVYGEVAQGYVHVHHLRPLAALNGKYRVDPARDLRPVCPNCHAIIHLETPPHTIQQVRRFLQAQRKSETPLGRAAPAAKRLDSTKRMQVRGRRKLTAMMSNACHNA
jgi:putative restriction endonuclease